MHERSLVRSLLRQVDEIAAENRAERVDEVTVEIGPLAGVETDLVRIAFAELQSVAEFAKDPIVRGSFARSTTVETKLTIVEAALTIRCLECDHISQIVGFVFRCHNCGLGNVKIISGDEFQLLSITLAESSLHVQ